MEKGVNGGLLKLSAVRFTCAILRKSADIN